MASYTSPPPPNSSDLDSATDSPRESRASNGSSKDSLHQTDTMVTAQPDVDRNTPVNVQLEKAERYIQSSRRAIDFRLPPEIAYKDYLKGADIVVNYIPRHKDFGFYCDNQKGWESRYKALLRLVQEMDPEIEQVRLQVQEDNAKRRPQPIGESTGWHGQVYSSGFGVPSPGVSPKILSMPSPPRNIPDQLKPAVR